MATKDFEVQQLFKAYRSGVISEGLFAQEMDELVADGNGHAAVPNVFELRGDGAKVVQKMLGKTPQTEAMVFSIPPGFGDGRENSHRGDQLIYVIEGKRPAASRARNARSGSRRLHHDSRRRAAYVANHDREAVRAHRFCTSRRLDGDQVGSTTGIARSIPSTRLGM